MNITKKTKIRNKSIEGWDAEKSFNRIEKQLIRSGFKCIDKKYTLTNYIDKTIYRYIKEDSNEEFLLTMSYGVIKTFNEVILQRVK